MNKPLSKLSIAELKEEFIQYSHQLTAAIDAGVPITELEALRGKMIEVIDELHNKALSVKNEKQDH